MIRRTADGFEIEYETDLERVLLWVSPYGVFESRALKHIVTPEALEAARREMDGG